MSKKKKKKKIKLLNVFIIIVNLFFLISLVIFSYYLFDANILPTKYLYIVYGIIIGLFLLLSLGIKFIRIKLIKAILIFVELALSIGLLYGAVKYLGSTANLFKNLNRKYDVTSYSVIVLNDSEYAEIYDLYNKNIGYSQDENTSKISKEVNKKVAYTEKIVTDFGSLPKMLTDNQLDAIVLESSYISIIKDEMPDFDEYYKVIYTFDIKSKVKIEKKKIDFNVTSDAFILYLSGVDQYGNVNSVKGRSDVNQLAVINPRSHHILLVNTPRDYYVQLAGTTGMKDKLTHAGIYGINKSIQTIENIYDIDINHYVRVNFNTVIKLVDVIGGIDINSDTAFVPWTDTSVYIKKGMNHLNGKQTLAYARERHAYADGDNHRGANQQQVITEIINKLTKDKMSTLNRYDKILNTLKGSFQTDMSEEEIQKLIKFQLDKMPSWRIESIAVTGTGSENYTYSMGTNYKLYVMEPDQKSIEAAKLKINEVLKEKK